MAALASAAGELLALALVVGLMVGCQALLNAHERRVHQRWLAAIDTERRRLDALGKAVQR